MESRNYTYERRAVKAKVHKSVINGIYVGGPYFSGYMQAWVIINPKGRKIAEATSEKQAELIVAALNGVAP